MQQPTATTVNVIVAPAITVQIVDSSGNRVTGSTATVALSSTPNGGLLAGTLTRTAVAGLATFDNIALEAVGTYTLQATSSGLTSATSAAFNITSTPAGPATALQFVAQPVTTPVDTFLAPVTVQIVDSVGTRVTTSTASVTVASTPDGARLLGTKTRNAVAGLATFDDLSVTVVATGYTLQATSSGLTSATSAAFAITSPPPPPPTLGLAPPHTGGFFRR